MTKNVTVQTICKDDRAALHH